MKNHVSTLPNDVHTPVNSNSRTNFILNITTQHLGRKEVPSITWRYPTDNTTCISDVLRRQEDPDELLDCQVFFTLKTKVMQSYKTLCSYHLYC